MRWVSAGSLPAYYPGGYGSLVPSVVAAHRASSVVHTELWYVLCQLLGSTAAGCGNAPHILPVSATKAALPSRLLDFASSRLALLLDFMQTFVAAGAPADPHLRGLVADVNAPSFLNPA